MPEPRRARRIQPSRQNQNGTQPALAGPRARCASPPVLGEERPSLSVQRHRAGERPPPRGYRAAPCPLRQGAEQLDPATRAHGTCTGDRASQALSSQPGPIGPARQMELESVFLLHPIGRARPGCQGRDEALPGGFRVARATPVILTRVGRGSRVRDLDPARRDPCRRRTAGPVPRGPAVPPHAFCQGLTLRPA